MINLDYICEILVPTEQLVNTFLLKNKQIRKIYFKNDNTQNYSYQGNDIMMDKLTWLESEIFM